MGIFDKFEKRAKDDRDSISNKFKLLHMQKQSVEQLEIYAKSDKLDVEANLLRDFAIEELRRRGHNMLADECQRMYLERKKEQEKIEEKRYYANQKKQEEEDTKTLENLKALKKNLESILKPKPPYKNG